MRKRHFVILFSALILFSCASQGQEPPQKQLFTAHNIWNHGYDLYCINYKSGQKIIPAGTRVKDVEIIDQKYPPSIVFRIAETNERVKIYFKSKWHPGQTVESYLEKMLTEMSFNELTQGLTEEEIKSIKRGVLTVGMSKEAVLISYGTPPEHYTKNLADERWYYWINKLKKKTICFDDKDRTIKCDDLEPEEL